MRILLVFSIVILILTGCSKEGFYENIYEGVRVQQQLDATGSDNAGEGQMTYRQYEAEKKASESTLEKSED